MRKQAPGDATRSYPRLRRTETLSKVFANYHHAHFTFEEATTPHFSSVLRASRSRKLSNSFKRVHQGLRKQAPGDATHSYPRLRRTETLSKVFANYRHAHFTFEEATTPHFSSVLRASRQTKRCRAQASFPRREAPPAKRGRERTPNATILQYYYNLFQSCFISFFCRAHLAATKHLSSMSEFSEAARPPRTRTRP